jgi:dATP pyrophosphohydrolase
MPYKQPLSVLVLVYTSDLAVLLIERADLSGTLAVGHRQRGSGRIAGARRGARARGGTGIDAGRYGGVTDWKMQNVFEIFARWRDRYAPGTTHNTEHVFGLEVPGLFRCASRRASTCARVWLPWRDAAQKVLLVDQPRGDRSAACPVLAHPAAAKDRTST